VQDVELESNKPVLFILDKPVYLTTKKSIYTYQSSKATSLLRNLAAGVVAIVSLSLSLSLVAQPIILPKKEKKEY